MNRLKSWRPELIAIGALLASCLGAWGAWIFNTSVGLTQNAFYLAEWSTFLPDVRYGSLRAVPDILRLAVMLGALSLAISVGYVHNWWGRWAIRLLLVPIGINLLPPYPDILSLWWSLSYGGRFVVAMLFWIGLAACLVLDRVNTKLRHWPIIVLAAGGVGCAIWSYVQLLPPFQAHYASALLPGWGLAVFLAGLIIAAGIHLSVYFAQWSGDREIKRGRLPDPGEGEDNI